jgi:hypothetical protein
LKGGNCAAVGRATPKNLANKTKPRASVREAALMSGSFPVVLFVQSCGRMRIARI